MTAGLSSKDRAALSANRFFREMSADARDAIADRGRMRLLKVGEAIFTKGDPGDGVFVVLSGSLRYSNVSASGKEALVNILGPGKWMGDISAIDGRGRTLDCVALEDSELMHLGNRDFNQLLDELPEFARMLLKIQGERIRDLLMWTEALTKLDAEGRLAVRLLIFAGAHGITAGHHALINLRLSQESLANLIGTTRQRVNQILNAWKASGIIELDGQGLTIRNMEAMKKLIDLS